MRYASVCSGIEAPAVAWEPLGWEPVFFSEIEAFPSEVLRHHYPGTPNLGNMCSIRKEVARERGPVDVFIGGTPCQSFSVAGLRAGLADPRGNLALEFLRIASDLQPRWVVWENVPGVLSSNGGRDFGAFLGALGELGYGYAYRVLDAQFFGVPQRRRRVFVVGHLGDWRRAVAVLSERFSLLGNSPPSCKAGEIASALTACGAGGGSGPDARDAQANHLVARTLTSKNTRLDSEMETFIPFDTNQITHPENRSNPAPGDPAPTLPNHGLAPAVAFSCKDYGGDAGELAPTLRALGEVDGNANGGGQVAIAFEPRVGRDRGRVSTSTFGALTREADRGDGHPCIAFSNNGGKTQLGVSEELSPPVTCSHGNPGYIAKSTVRRLTPRECERLQGFPDDYTLIPMGRAVRSKVDAEFARYLRQDYPNITDAEIARLAKDGPRYKAIGNSMAVPVIRWLGVRIAFVDKIEVKR
jgi:DNA (cytosine-5)-methyltransferase 1